MKKLLLLSFLCTFCLSAFAVNKHLHLKKIAVNQEFTNLPSDIFNQSTDDFLNLSPKKYRKMTGKKLGLMGAIKLKVAQKMLKKQLKKQQEDKLAAGTISKGLYIVLAIFGLGWLALGINDGWKGNNWWIALLLGLLGWIPGLIYTLVKMKNYY